MPSSSSRRMPCSIASSSPAARSGSRPASPRRGAAGGARREAVRGRLEGAGDVGELVAGDGTAGEREQPQEAPAFGAAAGQAGDHEIVEGAGQARVGDLAAGREQLLGDERQAARPIGHEDEGGARRALPFDRLDEVRELGPFERPDPDPERPRDVPRGRLRQRGVERMVPRQLVGRVRADEADPVVTADPAEERDEGAGAGVGVVEVLEDEEHRPPLAQPPDDPEQGFQHAALAPLRGDDRRLRGEDPGVVEPGLDLGEEPDDVLEGRPGEPHELVVVDVAEDRVEGADDRAVRLVRPGPVRPAADDGEGLGQAADPSRDLADEAADADAAGSVEEHGRRLAAGRLLQRRCEPDECRVASHEAGPVHRRGHAPHSRHRFPAGRACRSGSDAPGHARRCVPAPAIGPPPGEDRRATGNEPARGRASAMTA